jgi:hypothetical protein
VMARMTSRGCSQKSIPKRKRIGVLVNERSVCLGYSYRAETSWLHLPMQGRRRFIHISAKRHQVSGKINFTATPRGPEKVVKHLD